MQHPATFRVQIRTTGPGGGQGQRTTDDLLPGGQRSTSQSGGTAGHGDADRGGRRRNRGRMSGGQTSAVAPNRNGFDGFRLNVAKINLHTTMIFICKDID